MILFSKRWRRDEPFEHGACKHSVDYIATIRLKNDREIKNAMVFKFNKPLEKILRISISILNMVRTMFK